MRGYSHGFANCWDCATIRPKVYKDAANYQVVRVGNRTVAFTCGAGQCLFAVITFGTPDQQQTALG